MVMRPIYFCFIFFFLFFASTTSAQITGKYVHTYTLVDGFETGPIPGNKSLVKVVNRHRIKVDGVNYHKHDNQCYIAHYDINREYRSHDIEFSGKEMRIRWYNGNEEIETYVFLLRK